MDTFDDYTINGSGKCECASIHAQSSTAEEMRSQGLTESHSAILSPMSFRLMELKKPGAIQLESKYWIEYRGR